MQARMKSPVMILPDSMQALLALGTAAEKGFLVERSSSSSCGPVKSMGAVFVWTCTRAS
jgi:hypothetical protein